MVLERLKRALPQSRLGWVLAVDDRALVARHPRDDRLRPGADDGRPERRSAPTTGTRWSPTGTSSGRRSSRTTSSRSGTPTPAADTPTGAASRAAPPSSRPGSPSTCDDAAARAARRGLGERRPLRRRRVAARLTLHPQPRRPRARRRRLRRRRALGAANQPRATPGTWRTRSRRGSSTSTTAPSAADPSRGPPAPPLRRARGSVPRADDLHGRHLSAARRRSSPSPSTASSSPRRRGRSAPSSSGRAVAASSRSASRRRSSCPCSRCCRSTRASSTRTRRIDFGAFVDVLTSHEQDMSSGHARRQPVGLARVGDVRRLAGRRRGRCSVLLAGRGTRESPLKWAGLVLLVLGFGAFDPYAPWPLLHHLPVFQSQHVPSRWMYPSLLLLLAVTRVGARAAPRPRGRAARLARGGAPRGRRRASRTTSRPSRASRPCTCSRRRCRPCPSRPGPFHAEQHLPRRARVPVRVVARLAHGGDGEHRDHRLRHLPRLPQLLARPAGPRSGPRRPRRRRPGLPGRGVHRGRRRARRRSRTGRPNAVTVEVHGAQAGRATSCSTRTTTPGWSANGTPRRGTGTTR